MTSLRILAIVGVAGSVACAGGSGAAASSGNATPAATAADPNARTLVATLNPTNQSGANRIMGSVRLTPSGGAYRADVSIRNGGGTQNKYPWVIRPGSCAAPIGDILGNELSYKVLETVSDGSARVQAPLNVAIPDRVHHVEVLRSPQDRQTIVACGDLSAVR